MGGDGRKGGGPATPKSGPKAPGANPASPGGTPGGGGGGGGGKDKKPASTNPGGVSNPQGGGGSPGGGGSSMPPVPPPPKWYDSVPRHDKENLVHNDVELPRDTIKINPRWNEPTGPHGSNDYKNNCTRTSAAWILRTFFGFDVTAGEAPWKDPQTGWQNNTVRVDSNGNRVVAGDWYTDDITEKWIDPQTGRERDITKVPVIKVPDSSSANGERYQTNEEWYETLKKMILDSNPEGSGGLMRITGHIFNWRITGGKVRFIEPQPQPYAWEESYKKWDKDDKPLGSEWWMTDAHPTDTLNWFMRVDDMEPSKKLFDKKWVFVLTNGERTAPYFEDMVLQSYNLYPESVDSRSAFREGWDQVRRGRKPRIPTGWAGTEKEAPYRAGVEYARSPE